MNETSVSSIMSISTDAELIYNRYQSNQIYRFFDLSIDKSIPIFIDWLLRV